MPPRFAYWTILIDDRPTAFRAQYQEDLLPTLRQLQRANPGAVMKWFARGRLWESPEQARWAAQNVERRHQRPREWRPGGEHKDPRARFAKGGHRKRSVAAPRPRRRPPKKGTGRG
jgi:hypothetical protein